jgi:glycerol kinase
MAARRPAEDHQARAAETARWPQAADPAQDVYLVPAFVGLGAPYWDADCAARSSA